MNIGDKCRIRWIGAYGGLNPTSLREDGWTPETVLTVQEVAPDGDIVASWGGLDNERRKLKPAEVVPVSSLVLFKKGDRVAIVDDVISLPHPQHLYAGKVGAIVDSFQGVGGTVYQVAFSPEVSCSGADATSGVGFYGYELKAVPEE